MRMNMKPTIRFAPLLAIVSAFTLETADIRAQTNSSNPGSAAKNFVESFYSWYVPKSASGSETPTAENAIKYKKTMFTSELYKQLKEDFDAQAKVKDEIVGIDFDPFLNAQDVASKYVVGNAIKKKECFLVDVYGVWNGKKSAKPDVVPEVALKNGKWVFVNFHYGKTSIPENENLLSVLKALRESRSKPN